LRKSKLSTVTVLKVTELLEEKGIIETKYSYTSKGKIRMITFLDNNGKRKAISMLNSIKDTSDFFMNQEEIL